MTKCCEIYIIRVQLNFLLICVAYMSCVVHWEIYVFKKNLKNFKKFSINNEAFYLIYRLTHRFEHTFRGISTKYKQKRFLQKVWKSSTVSSWIIRSLLTVWKNFYYLLKLLRYLILLRNSKSSPPAKKLLLNVPWL